jgi:spermidine/putrescine-binding protein
MNLNQQTSRITWLVFLCVCGMVLFLTACAGAETPTPPGPLPPRSTSTPPRSPTTIQTPTSFPTPTPLPSPTPLDFFVSILNRRLTRAELLDAIRAEGQLTVAGWNYAAKDKLVEQFKAWVQDQYGIDVKLQYIADASPAQYLQNIYAAKASGSPAPYDVVAVEEIYLADALKNEVVQEILDSELLSNVPRIESVPLYEPFAVPFQAAATVGPVFHNQAVGDWLRDWKNLSDPRLNRRLTLPKPGSTAATVFLLGMANALGKDYTVSDDMRETIEYVCRQIHPNVLLYTDDFSEMQELLRENRIDAAVTWNLLARLEGLANEDTTQDLMFRPMAPGQPALNGYAWIPNNAAHPVLAQLFIRWRLTDDAQLPGESWGLTPIEWGEYHEGLLGESYRAAIPEWIAHRYEQLYPSPAQISGSYYAIDWNVVADHQAEWMSQYAACAK